MRKQKYDFSTLCLYAGKPENQRSHNVPIDMSVSYELRSASDLKEGFSGQLPMYGRLGCNPTAEYAEKKICALETLDMDGGGAKSRLRADGLNAVAMAIQGAMKSDEHAIVIGPIYGGTYDQIKLFEEDDYQFTFLAAEDPELIKNIKKSVRKNTKLILGEITCNPTISLWDVPSVKALLKYFPKQKIILAVDSSFTSPYNFRPFEWGADVIIHSATKYLGGRGAFTSGFILASKELLKNHSEFWQKVTKLANIKGGTPGVIETWLLGIFMEDLHLRTPVSNKNAFCLAKFLERNKNVISVNYPGLKSHPQHKLAKKLLVTPEGNNSFGGMLAFRIKGGLARAEEFLYNLTKRTLIKHKASLGYTKTICESPWLLSQGTMNEEHKKIFGITPDLIRVSVGTENYKYIKYAFEKGFR